MTGRFTRRTLVHFYLFLYKKMLCLLAPATLFLLSLFGVVSAADRHFGDCSNGCRVMFGAAYGGFEADGNTDVYRWPSGADPWAGVADECTPSSAECVGKGFESHGAFKFLNGGKITFSVEASSGITSSDLVDVAFKFANDDYLIAEDPSFFISKKVDISTDGDYEIDLTDASFVASTPGGSKTSFVASDYPNGFNKLHLYLDREKKGLDVTLTDIKVFEFEYKPTDAEMIEFLKAKQC